MKQMEPNKMHAYHLQHMRNLMSTNNASSNLKQGKGENKFIELNPDHFKNKERFYFFELF